MEEQIVVKRKSKFKLYSGIALLIVLLAIGIGGFLKYRQIQNKLKIATQTMAVNEDLTVEVAKYEILKDSVKNEIKRCENLILQEEGNFGDFSYCEDFLQFSQKIKPQL